MSMIATDILSLSLTLREQGDSREEALRLAWILTIAMPDQARTALAKILGVEGVVS